MITSLTPLDGRYAGTVQPLTDYFSEYALIRYRIFVEIRYFFALADIPLPQLADMSSGYRTALESIIINFDATEAAKVKDIEKTTNHDVKAVEYYIKNKMEAAGFSDFVEFIHFGLTSQDINNTAFPLMIRDATEKVLMPSFYEVLEAIESMAAEYRGIPMLARTHGQPASPTTLGKEMEVFAERLKNEINILHSVRLKIKFGGATGNFNAHKVCYPTVDWPAFADRLAAHLGLERYTHTTQIAHYDDHAAVFHSWSRINTILTDFCRDMWTYISMEYFRQKTKAGEVGSSAMPHKVNPIDFENAEGNLAVAHALFVFLAAKLPVSRLQRDLTDSTVLRNAGVPYGHTLIALKSIVKGIHKLMLNRTALERDLSQNWAVVAEAIQNILRREKYPKPYEALKDLTRGKAEISQSDIHAFIDSLAVSDKVKNEMLAITPHNYTGYQ